MTMTQAIEGEGKLWMITMISMMTMTIMTMMIMTMMTMTIMVKVMEREGKLGELEVRAETLQQGSEQFQVIIICVHILFLAGFGPS